MERIIAAATTVVAVWERGYIEEDMRGPTGELAAALAHRQDGELLASLLSRPSRVWRSESETGTEELARGIVIDPIELRTLAASPRGVDAYAAGWRNAAKWANRDDLLADVGSPAYERDKAAALSQPSGEG